MLLPVLSLRARSHHAGAHTLVCASPQDPTLRFFNLDTRSSYVIPLRVEDDAVPASPPVAVTALAYGRAAGVLAAALSDGRLLCFQHVHERRCARRLLCAVP